MSDQTPIFVGRQAQLDELNSHWRDAYHKKQGKIVLLVGEAGIGKTSLVEQFSRSVLKNYSGVQYAYAQCDQVAGDISPYAPFVQILNSLTEQAARLGDNWFVEYMREVGPDVLGMVPVAGPLLTATAKSVDFVWQRRQRPERRDQFGQQDLFQQFTDSFCRIATKKNPLLLCIDDWHWADTSSTNLLFHLSRQLSDVPLLLVATYRPHDAEVREHPILKVRAEMERYQLCAGISLDFLSREDVVAYLGQRFPEAQFEPAFVDWLMDTTSGNALFTTEYLNLLLNEKLLTPAGRLTGDLSQLEPPQNVEAVIRTRIGYLDREARDMLAYGSVEGEQFTTLVLSRLLDIKPLSLIRKLRTIEETHHLIASLGQQSVYEQQTTVYRFVHALIYRTLYNILEEEERIEISRLLLELLNEIYEQADDATKTQMFPELMAHAAEAGDHLAEARYALAAAEDAAANYAHEEIRKQCARGLEALDKIANPKPEVESLRIDLLLRQGRTEEFVSLWQQASETYYQVKPLIEQHKDSTKLAQVLNRLGNVLRNLGHYNQAMDYFKESVLLADKTGATTELALAHYGIGAIHWQQGNDDKALEWYRKSLGTQEELGNETGVAFCYTGIGRVYHRRGDYSQALESFEKTKTINEILGDKVEMGWAYKNIGLVYADQDDNNQALKAFQNALTLFQELDFQRGEAAAIASIGLVHKNWGDNSQALVYYYQAMAINERIRDKRGLGGNYNSIGQIYIEQGDNSQALKMYEKALSIWQELGFNEEKATATHGIGLVYEVQANYPQALDYYRQALAIREELGNPKDINETRQRIAEIEAKLAEQENGA